MRIAASKAATAARIHDEEEEWEMMKRNAAEDAAKEWEMMMRHNDDDDVDVEVEVEGDATAGMADVMLQRAVAAGAAAADRLERHVT